MTTPIHPFDLLKINQLIAQEDIDIRNWTRDFATAEIQPHLNSWIENKNAPIKELMREFGKIGLFYG